MELSNLLLIGGMDWESILKIAVVAIFFLLFAYVIKLLKIDMQVWKSLIAKVSALIKEAEIVIEGEKKGNEKKNYVELAIEPMLTKAEKKLAKKKGIGKVIDFVFKYIAPILARKI